LAALAATASAHGTVTGIVADGTYFGGYKLDYYYAAQNGQTPPATAGWSAENLDNGYVGGDRSAYDSPDIICHKNAKPGTSSATVKAGGKLAWQWSTWPQSHIGPVITYAANCGGDCSAVDKETLKWVKIDEAGYTNGKWAAVELISNNNTYEHTVPATLAAGKYVFRHEIIALHGAGSVNGAQNYPQCINIEVTGSGTASPEGTLGTKLYTAQEDGILFNPYVPTINYKIPGPALF
ncbi:glycoside hydrolase, partial [Byssothecium circinans]